MTDNKEIYKENIVENNENTEAFKKAKALKEKIDSDNKYIESKADKKRKYKYAIMAYLLIFIPACIGLYFGLKFIRNYNRQAEIEYSRLTEVHLEVVNQSDVDIDNIVVTIVSKNGKDDKDYSLGKIEKGKDTYLNHKKDVTKEYKSVKLVDSNGKVLEVGEVRLNTENKYKVIVKKDSKKDDLHYDVVNLLNR